MLRSLIAFCLSRRLLVMVAFLAFIGIGSVAFLALNIGVYVFLAALMLETYSLLAVAFVCFLAAFAPALKLVGHR